MKRRADVATGWLGFALLAFLHVDFWRSSPPTLHFGWVPEELLYRLGWIVLAWLYLCFVCARLWREE